MYQRFEKFSNKMIFQYAMKATMCLNNKNVYLQKKITAITKYEYRKAHKFSSKDKTENTQQKGIL